MGALVVISDAGAQTKEKEFWRGETAGHNVGGEGGREAFIL